MAISPTVYAGHAAVSALLAGKDVRVKSPEQPSMEFAMLTPTHSVSVACWNTDVVVSWMGASDIDEDSTSVRYPVPHDDPEFAARLGEVLLPVVNGYLARVAEVTA